jgi:hypothetical protein
MIQKYINYILKAILAIVYTIVTILGLCIVTGIGYGALVESIKHFNKPPKVEE